MHISIFAHFTALSCLAVQMLQTGLALRDDDQPGAISGSERALPAWRAASLAHGLIDELHRLIRPVVLGGG